MKDFTITKGKVLNLLHYQGKEHPLTRVYAGVAFAEDQQHGLVIVAEDDKRNLWVVSEYTTSRQDEFFRQLSMVNQKYLVRDGYHQPDRWAASLALAYQRWVTDNKPDSEMFLLPDPDGQMEDDAPRLISTLESRIEKTRRRINPRCKGLVDDLRLLGQPREQLRRVLRQHPLMHAFSLALSAMSFFNPPTIKKRGDIKRRVPLHEQILANSGRISLK